MFRYFEVAEHELMRGLGVPYATTLLGQAFPRAHLSCDFRGAISYDDELDITARIAHVGTSSWTVAFTARNVSRIPDGVSASDAPLVAEGKMVIVSMDPTTERATPLPEELRSVLERARQDH
jgi:acyl-CoA thioesterase FadM